MQSGSFRSPTPFCSLPRDVRKHLLGMVRPIDLYQMLFASFSLKISVLNVFPNLNLVHHIQQALGGKSRYSEHFPELLEMIDEGKHEIFMYGSLLFAALRGEDWHIGGGISVGDIDLASSENVLNPRSFAARTRGFFYRKAEGWDNVIEELMPRVYKIADMPSYNSMATAFRMSVAYTRDYGNIDVAELQPGVFPLEHAKESPFAFLHAVCKLGKTFELQMSRDTANNISSPLPTASLHWKQLRSNHGHKWQERAKRGQCRLLVEYSKKE